jgi:hypothetical protein
MPEQFAAVIPGGIATCVVAILGVCVAEWWGWRRRRGRSA